MLKLPSELAVSHVEELHQQLLHEIHDVRDITVDVSDVIRVDTATVQLLCALQKQLLSVGHKVVWHGKSEALSESVKDLGLSEFLNLQIEL
ncbi:STAS domain-containing protein [Pseudoalteromonas xiamenensis]|uniref:STAS domain-containing protein n=1 Tax=Pseudoalteromonas xiamenensis TaxID=882626 RepID=A0A975HJY8_9GAMM|nr:STAS domain-containing protein [Pseudoalteromonas xiamenensis]QTH70481.1 STAS domain-containing protein [Pseudoalteromonas xiamenensis]WMN58738.1 STAS domain-containing protein [Pseudoalteromonas xiamenensis]